MGRNYLGSGCRDIIHFLVFSVRPRIRAIYPWPRSTRHRHCRFYGLRFPAFFLAVFGLSVLPCPVLAKETSRPSDQHQHRQLFRSLADPRHRPLHRAENPRHPQILRRFQERRRSPLHQRYRPQKTRKMRKFLTVGKPPSKKQSTAPQTAAAPTKPPPQNHPPSNQAHLHPPQAKTKSRRPPVSCYRLSDLCYPERTASPGLNPL
jgi:hypothetical protein